MKIKNDYIEVNSGPVVNEKGTVERKFVFHIHPIRFIKDMSYPFVRPPELVEQDRPDHWISRGPNRPNDFDIPVF